jgi:glycosyltransferase involved in cell wall biosynthesis
MKPRVSIVLPTYNRRDTIRRAVDSVLEQTFEDWELVVVDDGSTDGTRDLLDGIDRRVRIVAQKNGGVATARNTGLVQARGELIAFLDSDDAWPSHHLALATAFFDAHPDAHVFTSEFWEDFGNGDYVKHFRVETGDWYPATARRIGSHAFDARPPRGDPYLWFYETREELGAWARPALEGTPYGGALLYRGDIFRGWRWGWLMAMQPTVVTRHAMETVGPNDTSYPIASDFGYLAGLCRTFPVSFVSAPGCIKYERDGAHSLAQDHLVTGPTAIQFHEDVLRFHEELFVSDAPDDPELRALRGFRQTLVARAALRLGARDVALAYLEEASRSYPGADTRALRLLARAVPQGKLASLLYRGSVAGAGWAHKVRRAARVAP